MQDSALAMEVVRALREKCGLQEVVSTIELGETFEFDAVMVGPDPLELVIVEARRHVTESELKNVVRKFESFVWNLHVMNKRHMVSAVIAVEESPQPLHTESLLRRLRGTCRVFLVSAETTKIGPLIGNADIAGPDPSDRSAAELSGRAKRLSSALGTPEGTELIQAAWACRSPDEVRSKFSERFAELTRRVEDALTEPQR